MKKRNLTLTLQPDWRASAARYGADFGRDACPGISQYLMGETR